MLNQKSILVTGGTGSFGRQFCKTILRRYRPERLIIYSRDELKQYEMSMEPAFQDPAMRFFLGDVRDQQRLRRAMSEVDYVVHAAALKQVPAAEYNPHEFIKTNINGAMNVVEAAIEAGVDRVVALSTDKAVTPLNLYGATKLCSDKIFVAANSYRGRNGPSFSVVRYGNVVGSRGSVIPRFLNQVRQGALTLTDPRMTRFLITLEEAARFVLARLEGMVGGELFVPKLPSCRLSDLATAIGPDCEHKVIGLRPGEKMHESLIPQDEAHLCLEFEYYYLIEPIMAFWRKHPPPEAGRRVHPEFTYISNVNTHWLTVGDLRELSGKIAAELGIPTSLEKPINGARSAGLPLGQAIGV